MVSAERAARSNLREQQQLEQLAATTTRGVKSRKELVAKIAANLKVHSIIEEEIFYPAFSNAGDNHDDAKMYFEALEGHRAAGDLVLPDLLATDPSSEKFSGRAKVLKEMVEHHIKEEEGDMFPRAKKLLDKAQLAELGERLERRKKELMGS